MRTIVKGKNMDVPDAVRQYAERKTRRLERFLDDRTDAIIELSVERHRSADDSRIADVTLVIDGQTVRGRADASTWEAAIDDVVDKVERRAVDHREKPRVRARGPEEKEILARIADGTSDAGRERRVVKTKRFALEPMFEEDAIAEMEDAGPRVLHLRQRRERAAEPPLPAPGRRLRAHRADHRRDVHARPGREARDEGLTGGRAATR